MDKGDSVYGKTTGYQMCDPYWRNVEVIDSISKTLRDSEKNQLQKCKVSLDLELNAILHVIFACFEIAVLGGL